jgi:hypothetical protein
LKSVGVPTWSHGGILCTGESYKGKVKLTFFKGAALAAGQNGGTKRAIDFKKCESLNE